MQSINLHPKRHQKKSWIASDTFGDDLLSEMIINGRNAWQNVRRIELNSSLFIDIRSGRCRQNRTRCVRNSSWQFADWKQTCTTNETGEVEYDRRINVENNDELNAMWTWQHDARTHSAALNYIRFVLHFYYVCWFILLFSERNGIIAIIFEWHSSSNCQRCRLCRRRLTSTVQKKSELNTLIAQTSAVTECSGGEIKLSAQARSSDKKKYE